MVTQRKSTAPAAAALVMALVAPLVAQHEGHQTPGSASAEQIASCGQNSQAVSRIVDSANASIEDARQANDAAAMRAVVADLQVSLARIKTQLADCLALTAASGAMSGSMPGMQHNMPSMQHTMPAAGTAAPAAAGVAAPAEPNQRAGSSAAPSQSSARLDISLVSQPNPPKLGQNQFDVTVKGSDGRPITDADVSLLFIMPAMPQMNMPETRNEVKLASVGAGKYTGNGQVMMAGTWNVRVSVKQKGREIGQKKVTLTAR